MGLRTKLLITLLGLLVLPLAILSGGAYWFFASKMHAEAVSYQRNISGQLVIGAHAEIVRLTSLLKQFSESARIGAALAANDAGELQVLSNSLHRLLGDQSVVFFYDADGQHLIHSPASLQVSGRALPLSVLEEDYVIESGLRRRFSVTRNGDRDLQSLAPVRGAGGDVVAYIAVSSNLQVFAQMIDENDSDTTHLFFSDNFGELLVKSPEVEFSSLPVEAMTNFASGTHQQFIEMEIEGSAYLLNMQRIAADLWLGSMLDEEVIAGSSLSLLFVLLPAAALILVFTAFVFYLKVAALVIKPIEELIGATREIAAGDYQPEIAIDSSDELGELANAFRDMGSQLESSSQQIARLAYFDPLTQLPNRNTLKVMLGSIIEQARRNDTRLAVLFIDLDDFKKVNDRLGHQAGDELLVKVGERLQKCLRTGDLLVGHDTDEIPEQVISRRGGDEFNAILNNVHNGREAALVAERLIMDINEPLMIHGSQVAVGASIGVAMFPEDGEDAEVLLRNADMAMYQAKLQGKNKYYLFTEAMNAQVHERLELEQSVARGLQRNEFELYYQPKIDLSTMTIGGFEALIRWINPERGVVSPAEFIPLAEESQLIHDIGHWVMAEALHQINQWHELLPSGVRIAINVSARQMAQENFAEHLISLAEQFNVPLTRLEVELTETSILIDEVLVKQHLYALRTVGVKISLDDFGTGYSSLTFLRNLPIDSVKIDRSFVMRLQDDEESQAIVFSVLELCRRLSLETVAEGVETAEQVAYLAENGCSEGQGYLFARPMPADEVLDFLRSPSYLAL
ncbi:MAG: putative bifunctional diguanylate cyclase/phosphodiesterase [Cellvibrionaceae bacterium]